MKKNAIMLADTRPALVGTVLLQLKETNPHLFSEALIYYVDPIPEQDQKLMCDIMPCRFIHYTPPLSNSLFEKPRFKRFSSLMFCRYEMFSFLDEFDTVTWLDTDILIQRELSEMIAAAEKTGAVFIREDPINKTADKPDRMKTCFSKPLPTTEFDTDKYLYCSGTIVLSKKIGISTECTDWCYKYTELWADILDLPDQGVLNAAIQKFNIHVRVIPGKLYCCYPGLKRNCSDAYIIHAWGSNKFWNDWYIYSNYPDWNKYYSQWCLSGGSSLSYEILPSISVVIPSYKPNLSFMKECLDSLLSQTRNNWERFSDFEVLIIAEPYDQENIQKLVSSYKDKRFRLVFNNERLGIAASLNKGILLSIGKYIARLDDDDICTPSRLYLQKEYLDSHPNISLCTSNFEYFGDMNERRVSFEGEMARAWSIFTCPFDHPTAMLRKDFFISNNLFYDEKRGYVEDWELWRRAFKKGLTIGNIPEVLFYHRWINAGSAGQTNKTVEMMQEMVQTGFQELNVYIPTQDLSFIGPWNGKIISSENLNRLNFYFQEALKQNEHLKIYDQSSLKEVFSLRQAEAETGNLPGLSEKSNGKTAVLQENTNGPIISSSYTHRPPLWKRALKKILRPFYLPFYRRYEQRILNLQTSEWVNEGHLLNCINKLDFLLTTQEKLLHRIELLETMQQQSCWETDDLKDLLTSILTYLTKLEFSQQDQLEKILSEKSDLQQLKSDLTQIQTYLKDGSQLFFNQRVSDLNLLQKNNIELIDELKNDLKNQLCWFKQDLSADIISQKTTELHRHIDFTYRDIMIALDKGMSSYLPSKKLHLETNYPVAYESLDHLYPHGTIRDNTRYPRFVKKCEDLFPSKSQSELTFLDLGCSGGGMVLEAALRGHLSVGLEGSDCSLHEQRAEWRLLDDRLMTCDITKPFSLKTADGQIQKFDIITAWEVLEHIAEDDLDQLFANIKLHLNSSGVFVASIANWEDIDPISGINWHVTTQPYEWWKNRFKAAGFYICTELFDTIDLARGGYNPPHCYENPYPEVDLNKSFHIAVKTSALYD